jgi:hypothetical protein
MLNRLFILSQLEILSAVRKIFGQATVGAGHAREQTNIAGMARSYN